MKREQKIQEILKRADEYAATGKHDNWLSIERRISSEGFPEARRVLDERFIRDRLDSLCKVATSPEEVERRNLFDSWLNEQVGEVQATAKEAAPEVSLTVVEGTAYIHGPAHRFEISRAFGSRALVVTNVFKDDDRWYRNISPKQIPNSNFDEITGERAVELFMGFVHKSEDKS